MSVNSTLLNLSYFVRLRLLKLTLNIDLCIGISTFGANKINWLIQQLNSLFIKLPVDDYLFNFWMRLNVDTNCR